jgi:hypothetical protein
MREQQSDYLSGGSNAGKRSNTERDEKKSGMGTDQEHQSVARSTLARLFQKSLGAK